MEQWIIEQMKTIEMRSLIMVIISIWFVIGGLTYDIILSLCDKHYIRASVCFIILVIMFLQFLGELRIL